METPHQALPAHHEPPKVELPKKPEGWWNLAGLSGSLAGVLAAVDAAADIPQHWKDAIKADVTAKCGTEFNFVYLDAHYMTGDHGAVMGYHCTPDKKLL